MPSWAVLKVLTHEVTAGKQRAPRVPEPDLVMNDPDKVEAYTRAGRADGVMAPVYLFHCINICEVIRPGDTVLDLACGPATQLAQVAALNPNVRFIGVDLSEPMLERAREHVSALKLENVRFQLASITDLASFADRTIDAVISTMALHHLPAVSDLERTFVEVARILKEDGGIYVVDFGHLRSEKSIDYFAHQYADRQPELFTLDYLYSLRAAFSLEDFRAAAAPMRERARLYSTFAFPFMIALKSAVRRASDPALAAALLGKIRALPRHHQVDFADLKTFFGMGGLRPRLLQSRQ
jgi:ubiquinone/menaquinone biosynthesis C-methylase UbiE